jgi:hypothetical protein
MHLWEEKNDKPFKRFQKRFNVLFARVNRPTCVQNPSHFCKKSGMDLNGSILFFKNPTLFIIHIELFLLFRYIFLVFLF